MYSGLAKLLDKPFILGFFLPSLLGIFAFLFANSDAEPFKTWLGAALSGSNDLAGVASVLGAVWIFAVFLMALNRPAYQIMEGYFWPWTCEWAKQSEKQQRKALRMRAVIRYADYQRALSEQTRVESASPRSKQAADAKAACSLLYDRYLEADEKRWTDFPDNADDVLATRFGNVIRSFELYPSHVYEADSIHVWSRLMGVIPKDYQAIMADARSTVDFFVSLVMLAYVTALATAGRALWYWISHTPDTDALIVRLFENAGIALLVACICYGRAVAAARQWGNYVKGAFDLYLPALAQTLGYVLPQTEEDQRIFWDSWSAQFRFYKRAGKPSWIRAGTPPPAPKDEPEPEAEEEADKDEEASSKSRGGKDRLSAKP